MPGSFRGRGAEGSDFERCEPSSHVGMLEAPRRNAQKVRNRRTICLAPRPLFPRVVAPLEGRSSGSRINRSYAPSQLSRKSASGSIRRSSPVTATGSRRIYTGFPRVEHTPKQPFVWLLRSVSSRPVPTTDLIDSNRIPSTVSGEGRLAQRSGGCNSPRTSLRTAHKFAVQSRVWADLVFLNAQLFRGVAETISCGTTLAMTLRSPTKR